MSCERSSYRSCRTQKDHSIASTATLAMTELRLMLEEEQVVAACHCRSRLISRSCAVQRARQESEVRLIHLTDQLNTAQVTASTELPVRGGPSMMAAGCTAGGTQKA
jgi:hypothetical protein